MILSLESRIALETTWAVVLGCFLLLRFWIHRRKHRTWALIASDVCITLGWVGLVASSGIFVYEAKELIKYNAWLRSLGLEAMEEEILRLNNHPLLRPEIHKLQFFSLVTYYIGLWFIKGAFLAFYFDLFPHVQKRLRWALCATAVYTAASLLFNILALTLNCQPISANWTPGPKRCLQLKNITFLSIGYATNITTDILIILLPTSILHSILAHKHHRHRLHRNDYFVLSFVIFVGILSILASTTRFAVIYRNSTSNNKALRESADELANIQVWTLVETWMAMLSFLLPSMRVFIRERGSLVQLTGENGMVKRLSRRLSGRKPSIAGSESHQLSTGNKRNFHEIEPSASYGNWSTKLVRKGRSGTLHSAYKVPLEFVIATTKTEEKKGESEDAAGEDISIIEQYRTAGGEDFFYEEAATPRTVRFPEPTYPSWREIAKF